MTKRLRLLETGLIYANPHQGDWVINAYHPRIVEVTPGELLCAYRRGAAIYADDGRTYLLRSPDGGRSWQDEGCLWDGAADPRPYAYAATSLSLIRDDLLVLSGFRFHRPQPDLTFYNQATGACIPEESVLFFSSDKGRSWSPPRPIRKPAGAYLEIYGPVVPLADGRWLQAFDAGKAYDDPTPLQAHVSGLCSDDGGCTWAETVRIAGGPGAAKQTFPECRDRSEEHRGSNLKEGSTWHGY